MVLSLLEEIKNRCQALADSLDPQSLKRGEALRCLLLFDDVLQAITNCMGRLEELQQIAQPGPTLRSYMEEQKAALQRQADEIHQLRRELEEAAQLEEEWRRQAEEREQLERRLEELRRLQSLTDDLKLLRQQVETLQKRQEVLKAGDLEGELREAAQGLISLTEEQLQKMDREVRNLLRLAEKREQELIALRGQAEQARERYRRAQEEWSRVQEELKYMEEADRRIAMALPPDLPLPDGRYSQDILVALDQIKSLMGAIEEALRIAIGENERRQQRHPLFLG